jgi:hypothetical protein
MEWMTLIKLDGQYADDYIPAIRDYVSGDTWFLGDNEQYSRATAMQKLGELWERAE